LKKNLLKKKKYQHNLPTYTMNNIQLFWLFFFLYVPLFYMIPYSPFECRTFLHYQPTYLIDTGKLQQRFSISYCNVSFIEYVYVHDRREAEQYVNVNPIKTFYHTIFGGMSEWGLIVLRFITVYLFFTIVFHQFLFIRHEQMEKKITSLPIYYLM
jgi:hypothetical protein